MSEFKDALDVIDKLDPFEDGLKIYGEVQFNHTKTIRRALLIADRLMGEPSNEMVNAGIAAVYTELGVRYCAMDTFKAMRDQMLKEIENV